MESKKQAIIIGAGPAGLTAAYELLKKTNVCPVVLELSDLVGGISCTVNYKGNRIDIGGHRFFSKSDRVMNWWLDLLPLQQGVGAVQLAYQGKQIDWQGVELGPDPESDDKVMLLRERLSRIYYLQRFFDYPITLSARTLKNLGLVNVMKIAFSYFRARLLPIRNESNLEQFLINRFGFQLYDMFFKDYTEKVWGVPCSQISAEWGAQRIKGLSITGAILHAIKKMLPMRRDGLEKKTETSLIEQFLYPKYGPGQMWGVCADEIRKMGGTVLLNARVVGVNLSGNRVVSVEYVDEKTGKMESINGDLFFSSMPVRDFISCINEDVPQRVRSIADGLLYRDFFVVGLLLKSMRKQESGEYIKDNWIYIQEPGVSAGRLQVFNNWSEYLVADPSTVWVGVEYFCNETDELWKMSDGDAIAFAAAELEKIGLIDSDVVLDGTVVRMPKAYPAYFGTYDQFSVVKDWLCSIENLFPIGRNGMHRYNNQDHSMLTAMLTVDGLVDDSLQKEEIWNVNAEEEYHEQR